MSNEEIARRLHTKVEMTLAQMLPRPECRSRWQQWEYNREQIRRKLAQQLSPAQGLGINITIE